MAKRAASSDLGAEGMDRMAAPHVSLMSSAEDGNNSSTALATTPPPSEVSSKRRRATIIPKPKGKCCKACRQRDDDEDPVLKELNQRCEVTGRAVPFRHWRYAPYPDGSSQGELCWICGRIFDGTMASTEDPEAELHGRARGSTYTVATWTVYPLFCSLQFAIVKQWWLPHEIAVTHTTGPCDAALDLLCTVFAGTS